MEVNETLVDKLAHLSKLNFTEQEKKDISTDLQKMIGFVEKLSELDLENVAPLMHMSEELNILREDKIEGSITREEALTNAPATEGQFFLVPKVIKK